MIQRLGCLVASISFAFVGATAFADAWFTAKEAGGDLLATGGTWTKDDASWDASTQTYNNFNTPLKFEATNAKSNIVSITTSVKFTAKDELTTEEIDGAKGGLAVLEAEDGSETNYWGVVSGAWVKLAGAEPDLTQAVTASISLFTVGKDASKKTYINYTIGSTPLTVGGNADILTDVADASIKSVEYLGKCELASLSGATAAPYVAQGADKKFYASISAAGNQAVTIVNATSYTPTATTIGSCNISDPDGFLTLNQGSLANVGLKVATVNGQVVIRPNFTSNTGDGTSAANAWEIGSAADLKALSVGVASNKFGIADQYFKQTEDITWTADDGDFPGIGAEGAKDNLSYKDAEKSDSRNVEIFKAGAFKGIYDGANHTIADVIIPANDYAGFFGSVYNATVKNLKMSIKSGGTTDGNGGYAGECVALFVGCALNSTFENLVTIRGTAEGTSEFMVKKDAAAFVGYMAGGTLRNCTNNLDICTDKAERKTGGLVIITQGGHAEANATDVLIEGCVNNGNVRSTGKPTNGLAGIVGYCGMATKIKNCEFYGTVTPGAAGGLDASMVGHLDANTLTAEGVNKTSCTALRSLAQNSADGFMFATIAGDPAVATFVKNADLAAGNTYKVMASIAAPAADISLAKGQTIAFNNALYKTFDATAKIVAADTATTKITSVPSGTVTTYTCAEKAKATVNITMTGATATVSVAHGASVYEDTTITVTDVAATTGYEAPITVKINDVERTSYTTTASDTSIAIVITATSKIVPIEPDPQETDVPKITVDKDALAERGVDTSDIAKIKTYLKTKQPNGQKGWVNYALGIDDANEVANTPVLVDESTEADKIQINLGIDYKIDETSGCSAKIVKEGEEDGVQVSEDGEIILTDKTATEVFTVKFVVTDKEGKAETVVEKNVGIENKAIASEMEILSVPFTDMNSAEQISVDKLIKTMNLEEDDRLMVYNSTEGANEGWTYKNGVWSPDDGVGAAAETFVKPGDGIWFQRANPSESAKPVFKFGAFSATKAKTVAPADGWKLVANPNLTDEVNLNNDFVDNPAVDDEIQVETATVPTIYTYDGFEWGFDKLEVTGKSKTGRDITKKVRNTTDAKIGPGAGFWFGNSGSASKNLDWSKK